MRPRGKFMSLRNISTLSYDVILNGNPDRRNGQSRFVNCPIECMLHSIVSTRLGFKMHQIMCFVWVYHKPRVRPSNLLR